jgi:DNA-binding response OmpR family regulator
MNFDQQVDRATILVVDDHAELLESIRITFDSAGYAVLLAGDAASALALLESQDVDLILADIAMPNMNGYQFFERVRENSKWLRVPFVFLTARTMDSDIRYGKELGVDDYLTKPIQPEDLLASVAGKLRRARQLSVASDGAGSGGGETRFLEFGPLKIELDQHRVWMRGKSVRLSAKEFALIQHLAVQHGRVIPVTDLVLVTHGLNLNPDEAGNLLRPLIRSLRRKLGYEVGELGCIENVRGIGYRMVASSE